METKRNRSILTEFSRQTSGFASYKNYEKETQNLSCLCGEDDQIGHTCFKCRRYVHYCIDSEPNRGQLYECAPCLNKALDPIVKVRKVHIESYFQIENIFEFDNCISFEFYVGNEDIFHSFEIRGLKPGSTSLAWPMQGIFFVNGNQQTHELRALKINSNRKHKREEYFKINKSQLKLGKNFIRFRIPTLDRQRYEELFQHDTHKSIFYMSVNSTHELSTEALIKETFCERRLSKEGSINLLKRNMGEFQVTQTKLTLICPYTKDRIRVPIRGKYCRHFSCICLETLIASHRSLRFWGCPICQAKISEPYVDIWIYTMLKDNAAGEDVIVQGDGSYNWIKNESKAIELDSDSDSLYDRQQKKPEKIIQEPLRPAADLPLIRVVPEVERVAKPSPMLPEETVSVPLQEKKSVKKTKEARSTRPTEPMYEYEEGQEQEDQGDKRTQQFKKKRVDDLKDRMLNILTKQDHPAALPFPPPATERKLCDPVKKHKILVHDIQALYVREIPMHTFCKQNISYNTPFSRKIRLFLNDNPGLKNTFQETLNDLYV